MKQCGLKRLETMRSEFAIVGSSFASSILASILAKHGRDVVVFERERHPRFAIGESSTPSADATLIRLANRYDLAHLRALARHGTWIESFPQIRRGIKRGFSYFYHSQNEAFSEGRDYDRQLLVAASATSEVADTHWLRADVDQFLIQEATRWGARLIEGANVVHVEPRDSSVALRILDTPSGETSELVADWVIDGSGLGQVTPRLLGWEDQTHKLHTVSGAMFGHFENVVPWSAMLDSLGVNQRGHPFPCDQAALHHVFRDGWMWQLRFDHDVVSCGFVSKGLLEKRSPQDAWLERLSSFPSIAEQFRAAHCVGPHNGVTSIERLQRLTSRAVGPRLALLPNTVGLIDPLHSTGIAHNLLGAERLADIFLECKSEEERQRRLLEYEQGVFAEIFMIDRLVAAAYLGMANFDWFTVMALYYIAAATCFEIDMSEGKRPLFLYAHNQDFVSLTRQALTRLSQFDGSPSRELSLLITKELAASIEPFNRVGLFRPEVPNMYQYTAAQK